MVKIKIHRGTNQIGGSITEIYTENTHIFIDFGSELNTDPDESTDDKMIDMINHAKCDAVLFSHYHGDHVGLMQHIPQQDIRGHEIALCMGLEARKVLIRIHKTLANDDFENNENHKEILNLLIDRTRWTNLENLVPFTIGDFTITPVRVDHSAYDAYMFIIQAEGKNMIHTGDYRTHGRLGKNLFPNLTCALNDRGIVGKVDILLTEGTMMDRKDEEVLTEEQLEQKAFELLRKPENKCAFLLCSSTNVETIASFCNAAHKVGGRFYVNYYVYSQIKGYRKSAGKEDPRLQFPGTYLFEPFDYINPKLDGGKTQMQYMKDHGGVMMIGTTEAYKRRMDYFKEENPLLIYALWKGFINKEKYPDTYNECYGNLIKNWRHEVLHTSGHADVETIEKMIHLVKPRQGIIPIHTTKKTDFIKLNVGDIHVIIKEDGDEYDV